MGENTDTPGAQCMDTKACSGQHVVWACIAHRGEKPPLGKAGIMPEFNLASLIVVAAVAAVAIYAVRHLVRIGKGKDSCCSGAGGGARTVQKTKHVEVADTDPAHYPFTTQVRVRDMVCEGCVENVQNALNALPGTWATVDLASRTANVRTKAAPDVAALEKAIENAGYSVIRM